MFIQIIQGKTNDKAGLTRQNDRWEQELQPGAKGYLGMTGGVAEDGTAIFLARFESEAAANANSQRPEQGAWWNETAKYFDGEPAFRNCSEVDVTQIGDLDSAGFAQVMQGTCSDPARMRALDKKLMPELQRIRPDVLGSVRAWDGNDFTEVVYFTSEAAARDGERKMNESEPPAELEEYMALSGEMSFLDLKEPWVESP
jgi:hypothetical protein